LGLRGGRRWEEEASRTEVEEEGEPLGKWIRKENNRPNVKIRTPEKKTEREEKNHHRGWWMYT
jgi:hypothetical protein